MIFSFLRLFGLIIIGYLLFIYNKGRVYNGYLVWNDEIDSYSIVHHQFYLTSFDKYFYDFFEMIGVKLKHTVFNTNQVIGYDPLND